MYQEASEQLERRLTELQSQIDRLSVSLHLWREKQDHMQPMETRLSNLTEQCADIVDRWAVTGERHAQAVGELEQRLIDWNSVDARMQKDAAARMQELHRIIEHEWSALRRIHEEPVKQLREQAATLTEVSVAAATSAVSGFERAEARLAEIETGLHRRLAELSDQMQTAVAELRTPNRPHSQALTTPDPSPTWPLEGVVRLHNQLRRASDTADPVDALPSVNARRLSETAAPLAERMETLERALNDSQAEIREVAARSTRTGQAWWAAVILVAIGLVTAGVVVARLQRQVGAATARVTQAEQQAQAAAQAAKQQVAAARDDAGRQIAEARTAAFQAQTISNVLAAPDLLRMNLVGRDSTALASAHVLLSRSRGFVFSGSRLPSPRPNLVYQIWILTNTGAISMGVFVPDGTGTYTLAAEMPPTSRAITGVSVTVEPTGGGPVPTGATALSRPSLAPPSSAP